MNFTYQNDWVPLAQLVVALPLAVLSLCHPLVLSLRCLLSHHFSLSSCCALLSSSCCAGWLLRHLSTRRLLSSHCLVVPPSRRLVAPAGCPIISCRPLLLELTLSEPLTLDEEVHMQEEWHQDKRKCTFIILTRDLVLLDLDIVNNDRPSIAVASPMKQDEDEDW